MPVRNIFLFASIFGLAVQIYGQDNNTDALSNASEEKEAEIFERQVQVLWLESIAVILGTASCVLATLLCGISCAWRNAMIAALRRKIHERSDKRTKIFIASKTDVDASELLT